MISYLREEDKLSASETSWLNTHRRVTNALHDILQVETFDTERIPNNIVDTFTKSGYLLCASDTMDLTQ
jgi:hypothetical protein